MNSLPFFSPFVLGKKKNLLTVNIVVIFYVINTSINCCQRKINNRVSSGFEVFFCCVIPAKNIDTYIYNVHIMV